MNKKIRELTVTGLLTALAILIPLFMPVKITIPPFTMTLAAHVPCMLAMFVSPFATVLVGLGNAIGFLPLGPIVFSRALTHILFGLIGYFLMRKKYNYIFIAFITLIFHGVFEGLVTLAFAPLVLASGKAVGPAVAIATFGTFIHHVIDFAITTPILFALIKSKMISCELNLKTFKKRV